MFYVVDEGGFFLGAEKASCLPADTELFGFGSGEICQGATATDIAAAEDSRFFMYDMSGSWDDTLCICEADRKLPGDIKCLPVWNKASGRSIQKLPNFSQGILDLAALRNPFVHLMHLGAAYPPCLRTSDLVPQQAPKTLPQSWLTPFFWGEVASCLDNPSNNTIYPNPG